MALQASLKGTFDRVGVFSETDFRPDLKAFTMPTLVIHGDDDQIVPIDITAAPPPRRSRMRGLDVYKGAPHALYFTHKDKLNTDLLAFIKG